MWIKLIALCVALTCATAVGTCQDSRRVAGSVESNPSWTTFNSSHRLVVAVGDDEAEAATPSAKPISIPPDTFWYVRPGFMRLSQGWETVSYPALTGKDLAVIVKELREKEVPGLSLVGCESISDQDLAVLREATNLRFLDLNGEKSRCGPDIRGWGLATLGELRNLERLDLSGVGTTVREGEYGTGIRRGPGDQAFEFVARLERLERISLAGCSGLSAAIVPILAKAPRLRMWKLTRTKCDDDWVSQILSTKSHIESLDVAFTPITDKSLELCAQLTDLVDLDIGSCKLITDRGLLALSTSKSLRRVSLLGPRRMRRITDAGAAALARAMPKCQIVTEVK